MPKKTRSIEKGVSFIELIAASAVVFLGVFAGMKLFQQNYSAGVKIEKQKEVLTIDERLSSLFTVMNDFLISAANTCGCNQGQNIFQPYSPCTNLATAFENTWKTYTTQTLGLRSFALTWAHPTNDPISLPPGSSVGDAWISNLVQKCTSSQTLFNNASIAGKKGVHACFHLRPTVDSPVGSFVTKNLVFVEISFQFLDYTQLESGSMPGREITCTQWATPTLNRKRGYRATYAIFYANKSDKKPKFYSYVNARLGRSDPALPIP